MVKKNIEYELKNVFRGGRIKNNLILKLHTTFNMGGKAEYFFEAESREDLIKAKQISLKLKLPFFLIGGGSNLAIVKDRIQGLVVKNIYIKKEILKDKKDCVELLVSSGYPVSRLVSETIDEGISGFEYYKGLPGTVGGAIYMNSKWTKSFSCFADNLIYAYLLDKKGKVKKVNTDYFQFAYGFSILQKTKEILLEVAFSLKKKLPAILKKRADKVLAYRLITQPYGVATAGCFFKNISGKSAGYLIEQCGLKGYSIGNFSVSEKHANFIINRGKGRSEDLMKLVKLIKKKVKEKFGLELEEEVIIV